MKYKNMNNSIILKAVKTKTFVMSFYKGFYNFYVNS